MLLHSLMHIRNSILDDKLFHFKEILYYSEYIMNAKQVSSRSTVKKTGTKSVFITGKHKKRGNV